MEMLPELYPLTGLQIGDIQSYVSRAFLYFAPLSNRLLILVDNRPWLMNKHSRSARIWQLMVTKYRISPFTNTRTLHKPSNKGSETESRGSNNKPNQDRSKRSYRWLPVIDSSRWQENYLLSVMDPSKALHGFIVFELAWNDVHGINYVNELQTDTTLALEVAFMKKWEFYSPDQASSCMPSWFLGKISEMQSLKKNLRMLSDLDLHHWNDHSSSMFIQRSSPAELSDEEFLDVQESPLGTDDKIGSPDPCDKDGLQHKRICCFDHESDISPTQYADTLILFRFSDSLLPLKLKQIIMSDLRLLTLLEAGLPSWVIFFQSYPLFCHFYRPWMRYLARTLYILISLVTVIIGFYDLYKNVPLLKATAARLCGPLFGWIEGWDMVSRIRYLGTMLFLQNLEKGLKWFMIVSRAARTVLSEITRPLTGPLSGILEFTFPLWNSFAGTGWMFSSYVWSMIGSMYSPIVDLIEGVLWPFELLYSYIWSIAISFVPFLCSIWELFLVPIRCTLTMMDYMTSFLSEAFEFLRDVWESASSIFQFTISSGSKQGAYDISIWKGLWNDLFSQVFRASRSVINGLVAFFMACNRHRLSIYNHLRAFLQRLVHLTHFSPHTCHSRQKLLLENQDKEDFRECNHCK